MTDPTHSFASIFDTLADDVHRNAVDHGWWDGERNNGELIALIHSELSEALEGLRKGNPQDEHCPEFSSAEVELADAIIRIMDFSSARGWSVGSALVSKHRYNRGRSYRHGGKLM